MLRLKSGEKQEGAIRQYSWEFIIALCVVFLMSGGLQGLYSRSMTDYDDFNSKAQIRAVVEGKSEGSLFHAAILVPVYMYILFFLIKRWRDCASIIVRVWPVFLLSLLAIVSTIWSLDPKGTFIRSGNLMFGTLTGLYFAVRYSPEKFCQLMGRTYIWLSLLVFVALVVNPGQAVHHGVHFPALRGFFVHKNIMGETMLYGVIVALLLLRSPHERVLGRWLMFLTSAIIILSLSRTAWVVMFIVLVAYLGINLMRWNKAITILLISWSVILSTMVLSIVGYDAFFKEVMFLLNRDVTMTGRTEIWSLLFDAIRKNHLWFGFGYQSFWVSSEGALSVFLNKTGYVPPHAHNGWLQVMSHLGLVGVVLVLMALVVGLIRNLRVSLTAANPVYMSGILFLVMYICLNITETYLMVPEKLYWEIFVYYVCVNYVLSPVSLVSHEQERRVVITDRGTG